MSFPRFDGDVTADGTVQQRFLPVKNRVQFTNIHFYYIKKLSLYYLFSGSYMLIYVYLHIN